MTSAQGKDVSSYQPALTLPALAGLDYAWCKATEGLTVTDPRFAVNWNVLGQWGKPRGAYHEFVPRDSPTSQAQHFTSTVKPRPGDMLAVVASDYAGVTDAEILTFCDQVRVAAGPHCPVLVYSDLSVAKTLVATSRAYELWVAWPNATAPVPSQWAPARWKTWRMWQWGQTRGVDADAYNGTAADLAAWLKTYAPATNWTETLVNNLPTIASGAVDHLGGGNQIVHKLQGLLVAVGEANKITALAGLSIDGDFGAKTKTAVQAAQKFYGLTQDGIVGQQTWTALIAG